VDLSVLLRRMVSEDLLEDWGQIQYGYYTFANASPSKSVIPIKIRAILMNVSISGFNF
jgi:hypothetical protein